MNLNPQILFRPIFISFIIVSISACSDSESPQSGGKAPEAAKSEMTGEPSPMPSPDNAMPEQGAPMQEQQKAPAVLENGVIYQDEIYKDWPYTEAPPVTSEATVPEMIEKKAAEVKIYRIGRSS